MTFLSFCRILSSAAALGFCIGLTFGCGGGGGSSRAAQPIVPNFVLDMTPSTLTINGGVSNAGTGHPDTPQSDYFYVTNVPFISGDTITVSLSGAPAGVTISPTSFTLLPAQAQRITVTATTAAKPGFTALAVHAVSTSGTVHDGQMGLTVIGPYGIVMTPDRSMISIGAGASDAVFLTGTGLNGYTGGGPITISGMPSDVTRTLNVADTFGDGAYFPYTFTAATNASPSSNTINFDLAVDRTVIFAQPVPAYSHAQVTLNVNDGPDFKFSWTTDPSRNGVTNIGGKSATMNLTTTALAGFNAPVVYSFSNVPAGVTITPANFSMLPGSTQMLTFTVSSSAAAVETFIVLDALSGSLHHRLPVIYENER